MGSVNPPDIGPSLPPTPSWLKRAVWARFILLAIYLILTAGWYFILFSERNPLGLMETDVKDTWSFFGSYLIGTLILLPLQFLFLLGAPHLTWPRPRRRRSIFISLAVGSLLAVALSCGVYMAGTSLHKLIYEPDSFRTSWSMSTPTTTPATTAPVAPAQTQSSWISDIPWTFIGIIAAAWTVWFLIFALIGAGQWSSRFRRMYRILLGGTILELLITIPIDVQIRKKTNCYCGEGTFFSLIIGLTAIVWTFGPGVAILFLIRRNQRKIDSGNCLQCGYDLHGLTSDRCPECGTPFRKRRIIAVEKSE